MVETIMAVWFLIILSFCITITLKLDDIKCKLDKGELQLKHNKEDMISLSKHHAELQLLIIEAIKAENQTE